MFANGETVTRLRAKLVEDLYSGELTALDWTTPGTLDLPGCGVADGGSTEPLQEARSQVDADFDVIMDPGSDVRSTDRLIVRGLTCEVVGRPFDWASPFTGWRPGMIVRARVVEG